MDPTARANVPAEDGVPAGGHPLPLDVSHRTIDEGGSAWLIPVYLLFRPGFFFLRYGAACPIGLTLVILWLVSVVMAGNSLDLQLMMNPAAARLFGFDKSWGVFWAVAVGVSFCGLGVNAVVWVGWFWLRLLICGVRRPSFGVAMSIYTLASVIHAVPILAILIVIAARHDTPTDYFFSYEPWLVYASITTVVFGLWGTWAGYRGVREVFRVGRLAGGFWFLLVPGGTQVLLTILMIVGSGLFALLDPPDVDHPQTYEGELYGFDYPGNWVLDDENSAFDDGAIVLVTNGMQDAYVQLELFFWFDEPGDELDTIVDNFIDNTGFEFTADRDLERFAGLEGTGRRYHARLDGFPYVARVIVFEVSEWYHASAIVVTPPERDQSIRPAFDLILGSLDVRSPDRVPASLSDAYYVESGGIRALIPGNWTWSEYASGSRKQEEKTRSLEIYPHANGLLRFRWFVPDQTPAELLEEAIEAWAGEQEIIVRAPVGAWGPFEGSGAAFRYALEDGSESRMTILYAPDDDGGMLEVLVRTSAESQETLDPGFTFTEKTLEVE